MKCPKCGSKDIRKAGFRLSVKGKKQKYLCIHGHTFVKG